jgi:hypothetical protein
MNEKRKLSENENEYDPHSSSSSAYSSLYLTDGNTSGSSTTSPPKLIIIDEGTSVDVDDEDDNIIPLTLDYEDDDHLKSSTQMISSTSTQIRQLQLRDEKKIENNQFHVIFSL